MNKLLPPFAFSILALASSALSQVNVERLRRADSGKAISATLEIDLSLRTGNVEIFESGLGCRLDHIKARTATFFVGKGDLGWQGGERYSNKGLAHLRQTFRRQSRLQPELFLQWDYDKSRDLSFRGRVGVGVRIAALQRIATNLWWGSAYMFEHERLELGEQTHHAEGSSVHRWSNYISGKNRIDERIVATWTAYAQPRFDKPGDLRLLGEADMEIHLGKSVVFITTVDMRYDRKSPVDTKSLDTSLKTGLALQL